MSLCKDLYALIVFHVGWPSGCLTISIGIAERSHFLIKVQTFNNRLTIPRTVNTGALDVTASIISPVGTCLSPELAGSQHCDVHSAWFCPSGDGSASKRYWDEDIIEPEVEVTRRGKIQVPRSPGLGNSVRRDRIEGLTVQTAMWPA